MNYSEKKDLVAEYILGMERGYCTASYGTMSVSVDGTYTFSGYCDRCGRKIEDNSSPCPGYYFKPFDIIDLIRKIGENNYPIFLRFDSIRNKNRFTLIGPEGRITDTDDPFKSLIEHCVERFNLSNG